MQIRAQDISHAYHGEYFIALDDYYCGEQDDYCLRWPDTV